MQRRAASIAGASAVLLVSLVALAFANPGALGPAAIAAEQIRLQPSAAPSSSDSVEAYSLVDTWDNPEGASAPGFLLDPSGVAIDSDGTVFLVDAGRSRIHVFRNGAYESAWGTAGGELGQLMQPHGIALKGDALLVADTGNGRVQTFTKDGRYVDSWGGVGRPWDVAVVDDNRVLVTDADGDQVVVLDGDGLRLGAVGVSGSEFGQLLSPRGITAWPNGQMAIVDSGNNRVQVWTESGKVVTVITSTTLLPFVDVAAMGDDNLLIAGLRLLYNYVLSSGAPIATSRSPVPGGYSSVAVQPSATLPFTPTIFAGMRHDHLTGLRHFDNWRLLNPVDVLHLPGTAGEFSSPRRITVRGDTAYILDAWPRVQRLSTDGTAIDQIQIENVAEYVPFGDDAFVASGTSVRRMSGMSETWAWHAITDTTWLAGLAHDPAKDTLHTVDLISQSLFEFDDAGALAITRSLGTSGYESFTDLARTFDGRLLLVNRTRSEIEIRASDGSLVEQWPIRGVPLRVEPDPSGGAFVLTREGWVWKLSSSGQVLAWWDAAAAGTRGGVSRRGTPSDLALTGDGRVLVLDSRFDRVLVFALDPSVPPNPGPTGQGCTFVRDKWAEPPRIVLGETVGVTLSLEGECLREGQGADIVLVIDRSGSMVGRKIDAARTAAISFVGEIDFNVSRVGVVAFNLAATMPVSLTSEAAEVVEGVAGFGRAVGGTDIGEGLELAALELASNGRPGVEHIIVVMTDGRPEGDVIDADGAAAAAKAQGIRLFSIGFGTDADPELMKRIATSPDDYFFAPGSAELSAIYTEIARRITGGIIMQTSVITDVVPINMVYLPGSAVPPVVSYEDRELRWELTNVRGEVELTYRLRPLEVGTWPTNVDARTRYQDGHDIPGELVFPIPKVTVVAPPRPIYLPMVGGRICRPSEFHADVVLVLDASSSMTGAKLEGARDAARRFVDQLALPLDRAAIVSFNRSAYLLTELTGDSARVHTAIDQIAIIPGTVIDSGINLAVAELDSRRYREGNTRVMVVMTDGQNNAGPDPVLEAAKRARRHGILVYTVAYGKDADFELMRAVAGDSRRAFKALTAADLVRIYGEIAYTLPCP